jgi:hypothetical protein
MNERVTRFALGANLGFLRCYCSQCKSETLHRSQLCIHCGTNSAVEQRHDPKSALQRYKEGLQIKRRRA